MVREKSVQRRLTGVSLAAVLGLSATALTLGPTAARGGDVSDETSAANAAIDKAAAHESPKDDTRIDWTTERQDKLESSSAAYREDANPAYEVEKLKHDIMRLQYDLQRAQMQLKKYESLLKTFPRGAVTDPAAPDPLRTTPSSQLMIGGVLIHVDNGRLEASDPSNTKLLWAFSTGPGTQVTADEGGKVIVRWHGRGIVLDPTTGKELKQFFDSNGAPAGGEYGRGADVDRLKTLEERMDKLAQAVEGLVKLQKSSTEHAPRPGELQGY